MLQDPNQACRSYYFHIDKNPNYIVTGQRRAGKTFLLYYQIQQLIAGGRDKNEFLYVNFEDERLLEFKVSDFDLIIESYGELFELVPILFFDEIQHYCRMGKVCSSSGRF